MVDDDPQIQATLPLVLADGGHQVTLAANGKQALRELRTRPIDLVVTDILMPEMDGLELIRAVKKDHPGVKLLAISGGSARLPGTDALQVARLLGARRVLPKPFSADEVIAAIAEALESE